MEKQNMGIKHFMGNITILVGNIMSLKSLVYGEIVSSLNTWPFEGQFFATKCISFVANFDFPISLLQCSYSVDLLAKLFFTTNAFNGEICIFCT